MNRAFHLTMSLCVASGISVGVLPAAASDEATPSARSFEGPHVVAGSQTEPTPKLWWKLNEQGMTASASLSIAQRGEGVSSFSLDRYGTTYPSGFTYSPQLRIGSNFSTGKTLGKLMLSFNYEHDLPTGFVTTFDMPTGQEMPNGAPIDHQLRRLLVTVSLANRLHVGGGFTTNQFGLGLLANDGSTNNWTPGSATFADNRGGDRVLRAFVATGPLSNAGFKAAVAFDQIISDDILLPTDNAFQILGTLSAGRQVGNQGNVRGGVFIVHRRLTAQDGRHTEATAVDVTAHHENDVGDLSYSLDAEAAVIFGQTTLGVTPDVPVHDVLQMGGVVRGALRARRGGAVVDILFASGDNNPDDNRQTAFRADPNFEMGMLLYRNVLAAQTGRATATAGDPNLVGEPSTGLERVPTRGAPTNTVAIFPRFYVRPILGMEVYGGPLLALSMAPLYDPLNTRVAGGVVKNALGGSPGDVFGIEFDLGVRHRMLLWGTQLTVGVEGAMLVPGNAFTTMDGNPMGRVIGGRGLVQYRL